MKILGIDTTATTASVGIWEDGNPIAVYTQNGTLTHSETMLPMVENCLCNAALTVDDMDVLAVSAGPGSFTGVRIGVSLVKGLAFDKGKPCVGVSALEALAYNLLPLGAGGTPFYICPVMDARRNQLYSALFLCEAVEGGTPTLTRKTEDRMIDATSLGEELAALAYPIYFVGEGCRVTEKTIALPNAKEIAPAMRYQNGFSVAAVAARIYEEAEDKTVFTDLALQPTYLRASQAERERNGEAG